MQFDVIVGHNALFDRPDKGELVERLAAYLAPEGVLSLAERAPWHTQRIYRLVETGALDADLVRRWQEAEEAITERCRSAGELGRG